MITTHRTSLLPALKYCASIVPAKSTIPVLSMIRFAASENGIDIESSNLEMHLWHTAETEDGVGPKIDVLVSAREILALVQSLPADVALTISHEAPYLLIRAGKNKYRLPADDPAHFPEPTPAGSDATASIDLTLADLETFAAALHACSTDDLRSTLKAAWLHSNNGKLDIVCTDGHRLAFFPGDAVVPDDFPGALVPPAAIRMAMAMESQTIKATLYESCIHFAGANCSLRSQLVAGQYPNWRRVVPDIAEYIIAVVVPRQPLLDSLSRNQLFAERLQGGDISVSYLTFDAETLRVETASDSRGGGADIIPASATNTGEPFRIGLSAHYLRDAINALPGDEIIFNLKSPDKPAIITSHGAPGAFTLVMPRFGFGGVES